jgi:hypothetical protein
VHRQGGAAAVLNFLQGYLQGLWARVAFLAVLAWLLPQCTPGVAWAGAVLGAVAVTLALNWTPRAAAGLATIRQAWTW